MENLIKPVQRNLNRLFYSMIFSSNIKFSLTLNAGGLSLTAAIMINRLFMKVKIGNS